MALSRMFSKEHLRSKMSLKRNAGYQLFWGFTMLIALFLSCSEVIDLDSEGSDAFLVVDGRITDGAFGNEVRLAITSTINANQSPVSRANITLLEDGTAIANYIEYETGAYRLDYPNDSARVGRTYELLIELVDGRRYRSVPEVMPEHGVEDELRFEVGIVPVIVNETGLTQDKRLVSLYNRSRLLNPASETYLRWDIFETYILAERQRMVPPFTPFPVPCYITNDITGQQVRLFDGAELRVENIPEELITTVEVGSLFASGYFFNVVSSTLNRTAHEYYSRVDEIGNIDGTIFDTPPGPIPGNIINIDNPLERVLGYFQVANTDTTRIKVMVDDIPFPVPVACPDFNRFNEPHYCTNCLLFENSTTTQPFYWF